MQLVLSNSQGELSPLERGLHALQATEKGKHGKSIAAYAEKIGRPQQSVSLEICAARVASSYQTSSNFEDLVKKHNHLAEIHAAPQHCWPVQVERLVEESWSVEQTKMEVSVVRELK